MFPDQSWAEATGSFKRPVLPPVGEPGAAPTISVTLACNWLPYIRGALQQLLLQSTWDCDAATLAIVQGRVFNLIDLFQECSGGSIVPFNCAANFFLSSSPFGTWTRGFAGVWGLLAGWGNTAGDSPYGYYNGIGLDVTFDNPLTLTAIELDYNMVYGSFDGCGGPEVVAHVVDTTHGVQLWSATNATLAAGIAQTVTIPVSSVTLQALNFELDCDIHCDHSTSLGGLCNITGIRFIGDAASPPC